MTCPHCIRDHPPTFIATAGHASGGEIFVSGADCELVSGRASVVDHLRERSIRSVEQPLRVSSVRWA